MKKSFRALCATVAASCAVAMSVGMASAATEVPVEVPEDATEITVSFPVEAGEASIASAQIWFTFSDNLTYKSFSLEGIDKSVMPVETDDFGNTVGFASGKNVYTGNGGNFVLKFSYTGDEEGRIEITKGKMSTVNAPGDVTSTQMNNLVTYVVKRAGGSESSSSSESGSSSSSSESSGSGSESSGSGSSSGSSGANSSGGSSSSGSGSSGSTSNPDKDNPGMGIAYGSIAFIVVAAVVVEAIVLKNKKAKQG